MAKRKQRLSATERRRRRIQAKLNFGHPLTAEEMRFLRDHPGQFETARPPQTGRQTGRMDPKRRAAAERRGRILGPKAMDLPSLIKKAFGI